MEYMIPTMYIFNNHLALAVWLCQAFKVTEELVYEDPTEVAGVNVHDMMVSVFGDRRPFHTGIFVMLTSYLKILSADPSYFPILRIHKPYFTESSIHFLENWPVKQLSVLSPDTTAVIL